MEDLRPSPWPYVVRLTIYNLTTSFLVSLTGVARQSPIWLTTLAFGFSITGAVLLIQFLVPRMRRKSFFGTVIGQGFAIGLSMALGFITALIACIAFSANTSLFTHTLWVEIYKIVTNPQMIMFIFLSMGVAFVISGVLQFSRKLGPGVLRNWITGKYHEPKEEERIFMFLDLKDSTTLAERLGPKPFSALVRDFFHDLSEPCRLTKAEVSHYIGDEAVISWSPKNGLKDANCIRMFYLFGKSIQKRYEYYRSRYGIIPEYKAGIHIGPVVATEVGDAKSEIVFHGDVMNTTARIQSLCNETNATLLISGELAARLGTCISTFQAIPLGKRSLKGRLEPVEIVEIKDQS